MTVPFFKELVEKKPGFNGRFRHRGLLLVLYGLGCIKLKVSLQTFSTPLFFKFIPWLQILFVILYCIQFNSFLFIISNFHNYINNYDHNNWNHNNHSWQKFKIVLVRKPGRKLYSFHAKKLSKHNFWQSSSRISFHFLNSIFQGSRFSFQFLITIFQGSRISFRFLNFCQECYYSH